MLHFLPIQVRFLLGMTLAVANLLLVTLPLILPAAALKILIPYSGSRRFATSLINLGLNLWSQGNSLWLHLLNPTYRWDIRFQEKINKEDWYLMLANHQSASDIILMMWACKWKTSPFRFIAKREVALIPIVGWIVWAMDCPLMKRYSREKLAKNPHLKGKDLATTRRQCQKFRNSPISLVIYPEGTRFTPEKYSLHGSNYRHLLNPKAGGPLFAILSMDGMLTKVIDCTIVYETWEKGGFVSLVSGNLSGVVIDFRVIDIPDNIDMTSLPDNPKLRETFHAWLNTLWEEKDERIRQIRQAKGWSAPD